MLKNPNLVFGQPSGMSDPMGDMINNRFGIEYSAKWEEEYKFKLG